MMGLRRAEPFFMHHPTIDQIEKSGLVGSETQPAFA